MNTTTFQTFSRFFYDSRASRTERILASFAYAAMVVYLVGVFAQWWPPGEIFQLLDDVSYRLNQGLFWVLGISTPPAHTQTFFDQLGAQLGQGPR